MTDERVRKVGLANRLLTRPEFGAFLALVVVWIFFAIVAFDNNFVSWTTTASILNRAAPLGILAVAVALLMIAGEFDLSIGSIVGFAGMAVMLLVTPADAGGFGLPVWIAVLIALVITLLTGFFNGVLVMATRLPSFIITLGSLFIFRGLAVAIPRLMTNRTQLGGFEDYDSGGWAATFATKMELGGAKFDIAIIWWIAIAAIGTIVLLKTNIGNWIFGAGGDANAARNVGVPVAKLKIALFMMTALAAFIVALIQATQLNSADSLRGTLKEFEAIIAVVVGGTLLTGGYGSVLGPVFGALIFAMVQQGIIITGVDGDWFRVFVGGILVLAVIFNNFIRQRASKR
ncbi:MAG: ABC transporter permease [bacterium]|nr:ABC transporter permease [Acidimicrobiia bacterium]MCY4648835.1 ABC transporter permease [bacterium]